MNSIPKYIAAFVLFISAQATAQEIRMQQVFNASGGTAKEGNYSFEWSVGEMSSIKTYTGGSLLLTEGFCQPLLNLFTSNEILNAADLFQLYPNPAKQEIYLIGNIPNAGMGELSIHDVYGRKLRSKPILLHEQWKEKINVSDLSPGKYYFRIQFKKESSSRILQANLGWIKM
jgi:hypothetical protein